MEQFENAVSLREICRAARECKQGVSGKAAVMDFYCHRITKGAKLREEILRGTYKMRPGLPVQIYRPKRREATAPYFRDRVWQRSMCNNGVYDDLTRGFLATNMACQKGKGPDMAIRWVVATLQELYCEGGGKPIFGVHRDIRKYFPSTPHQEIKAMDRRRITEPRYLPFLDEIIDGNADKRPEEDVRADPFGPRGTGLGSQINQLNQVALPSELDWQIAALGVEYMRYNDDFLILSLDREKVQTAGRMIDAWAETHGLTVTDKGGLFRADQGFSFLRKRYIVKDGGKIIIRLHSKALSDERRALRVLKEDVDHGFLDMAAVQRHYQSWVANAEYAGDGPIRAMDQYYTVLFRQKPVYKRKRRYLYGNEPPKKHHPQRGKAGEGAGTGKRPAA